MKNKMKKCTDALSISKLTKLVNIAYKTIKKKP